MDDEVRREIHETRELLVEVLRLVGGLVEELDRYRGMLPEPGTIKARLLSGRVTAAASRAVDQWNGG